MKNRPGRCRSNDRSRPVRCSRPRAAVRQRWRRRGMATGRRRRTRTALRGGTGHLSVRYLRRPGPRRERVEDPGPSSDGPVNASVACSGCGISPTTRPLAELIRRCRAWSRWGCPRSGTPPALALEFVERRFACHITTFARFQRDSNSAPHSKRDVHAVVMESTVSHTSRQTKCRPALRVSAPGSSPASHRI